MNSGSFEDKFRLRLADDRANFGRKPPIVKLPDELTQAATTAAQSIINNATEIDKPVGDLPGVVSPTPETPIDPGEPSHAAQ